MRYFLFRMIKIIPVVFCVTLITFSLMHIGGGDPAVMHFHNQGFEPTPQMLADFREEHGLNDRLSMQYLRWWGNTLRLDFGESFEDGKPVSDKILAAFPYTFSLAINSIVLTVLLALPLGIFLALRENSIAGKGIAFFSLFLISLPSFIVGLLLIYIFTLQLKWIPLLSRDAGIAIILPTFTLCCSMGGRYIRQIKAIVKKIMHSDYIYGLRARGIPMRDIFWGTVLKNTAIELITIVGMSFGSLLSGVAIVETIFNLPGIGKLMADSVLAKDIPVMQACILILAILYTFVNLITDLLYTAFDPRIRLGEEV